MDLFDVGPKQRKIVQYKKITSCPVYPDLEKLRVEGEGRMEGTWARDLGTER